MQMQISVYAGISCRLIRPWRDPFLLVECLEQIPRESSGPATSLFFFFFFLALFV